MIIGGITAAIIVVRIFSDLWIYALKFPRITYSTQGTAG